MVESNYLALYTNMIVEGVSSYKLPLPYGGSVIVQGQNGVIVVYFTDHDLCMLIGDASDGMHHEIY